MWGFFKKKKRILVYDLAAVPNGKTIDDVIRDYHEKGQVLYDSRNGGHPPAIIEK